jgi:amino acid transporter
MSDKRASHPKLGQLAATAICGNDILSSSLYVSGIAILFAGVYAPLVLLFIGLVLYLYKKVYTEVVEALPVNGGAYNCLLNATSKTIAALAGVMTLLSYVATAVISAKVGVEYLNIAMGNRLPIIGVTIAVLLAFALLVISGVKDSAKVAIGIFLTHITTLTAFLMLGLIYVVMHAGGFFSGNVAMTHTLLTQHTNLWEMLYLAFSASLRRAIWP